MFVGASKRWTQERIISSYCMVFIIANVFGNRVGEVIFRNFQVGISIVLTPIRSGVGEGVLVIRNI